VDPWPPESTCNGDAGSEFTCKGKQAACKPNIYYDPKSKAGYNSMSSVCQPVSEISKQEDCKADDPRKYINCPQDYEGKSYFQDNCFFACQKKKDDGGWNWMMIIIIIAVVVGGLLLLMILFHHKS